MFIQRELDRIHAALGDEGTIPHYAQLYAAHQALAWALEPDHSHQSWAFRKSQEVVRLNLVWKRLQVPPREIGAYHFHPHTSATTCGPEPILTSFNTRNGFIKGELPPSTIGVDSPDVANAFVGALSVPFVNALDLNVGGNHSFVLAWNERSVGACNQRVVPLPLGDPLMEDAALIDGLLAKRQANAELPEKMAVVANDIEAVERVLDSLGYQGQLVGNTSGSARIPLP